MSLSVRKILTIRPIQNWAALHCPLLHIYCCYQCLDYSGNASGARRAKKRSSGESPGDGQTLRSSGRQINVRVKRTNNPPPGQVNCSMHVQPSSAWWTHSCLKFLTWSHLRSHLFVPDRSWVLRLILVFESLGNPMTISWDFFFFFSKTILGGIFGFNWQYIVDSHTWDYGETEQLYVTKDWLDSNQGRCGLHTRLSP